MTRLRQVDKLLLLQHYYSASLLSVSRLGALLTEEASFSSSSSEPFTKGLVQVFTGDGKGKTTAALGTVIRALGHGLRVCIVYFMKGSYPYGERNILSKLPNVTMASFGSLEFIDPTNVKPEEKEQARQALATAREAMLNDSYDLVVLDEVNLAVAWKLIELDEVIRLISDKPQNVELILTGRQADTRLVQMADLVTEMLKIKHPYDKGLTSRKGIEY
ncbi:cob(I)yrinic acid a,c-diamide adenosyltransferase [Chloroflexota bacterium]